MDEIEIACKKEPLFFRNKWCSRFYNFETLISAIKVGYATHIEKKKKDQYCKDINICRSLKQYKYI